MTTFGQRALAARARASGPRGAGRLETQTRLVAAAASHSDAANWLLVSTAVAGIVVRVIVEERLLTSRYPAYAAYILRTRRLIPFVW